MAKTKVGIVGRAGSLLSGGWGVYSTLTTVAQLPSDASSVAKMLADPPIYLPWLIMAVFVGLFAWAFWPNAERDSEPPVSGVSTGPGVGQTNFIHSGSGPQINNPAAVHIGRQRFELTPELLDQVTALLDKRFPVGILWRDFGRGTEIKDRLITHLEANGFTIGGRVSIERSGPPGRQNVFPNVINVAHDGFKFGMVTYLAGGQGVAIDMTAE